MNTALIISQPNSAKPFLRTTEKRVWYGSLSNTVFILMHAACVLIFVVGASWTAVAVGVFLYGVRMFAITGGYHRYFSHTSFRTGRTFQFILAFLGASAAQKGPLWWAAHHRNHHRYSDTEKDIHSPRHNTVWWAHAGWVLSPYFSKTDNKTIPDLLRFPELRWIDRWHITATAALAVAVYALGAACERFAPGLGTNGPQMLLWGFVVSTVVLWHATFTINSLAHLFGSRRYDNKDDSRNNIWLALLTFGEGWHNNHHRYPGSERQGFFWWEIDITHATLKILSWFGIVWDLHAPPQAVLDEAGS